MEESCDHFGAIVAVVTLDFTGRTIVVSGIPCRNPSCLLAFFRFPNHLIFPSCRGNRIVGVIYLF